MQVTKHAAARAQQRGIPPIVRHWLAEYGEKQHDGHGGICRYFSKKSRQRLERDFGREPIRRLNNYLNSYLIEACGTGQIITVGKRYAHIERH